MKLLLATLVAFCSLTAPAWAYVEKVEQLKTSGASGTAPVSGGTTLTMTDVATQAELNTHESDTTSVHGLSLPNTPAAGDILVRNAGNTLFEDVTMSGDATLAATGALTIAADAVVLGTDTSGNYVATIADSGASEVTVANSGTETAAVTLAIASGITRDTEWDTVAEINTATTDGDLAGEEITNVFTSTNTFPSGNLKVAGAISGTATFTVGSTSTAGNWLIPNTAGAGSTFVGTDTTATITGKTIAAADNVVGADTVADADFGDVTISGGVWAVDSGGVLWNQLGTAGATATIDFAGFDQDITSAEDGGDILTITNTDADRAADTVMLHLMDYDEQDPNAYFIKATGDSDGTPYTAFAVRQNTSAGANLYVGNVASDHTIIQIESRQTNKYSEAHFFTAGDDWAISAGGSTVSDIPNKISMFNRSDNSGYSQEWDSVPSAVNYIGFVNAVTTASPSIYAVGSDTNIGITLTPKGSGVVSIAVATATTPSADDNDTSVATTAYVQTEINALGGRSLTMTTGTMDADAELYTQTICYRLPASPVATDDDKSIWINDTANGFTVTKLWAESDQTVTLMLQVDDGTPADMDTVDLIAVTTPDTDTSLDGDATIAAGDRVDVDVASVSGTPTWCTICFTGEWAD